jgi:transposase
LGQHTAEKQSQRAHLLQPALIERFFNKIKQHRRIATRYDKLAANYLAFVQLATIRLWLRVNEYTP